MKTAEQIVEEAPLVTILEGHAEKLALCCSNCVWWTNDARKAERGRMDSLSCKLCKSPLKELPLMDLIESTRDENPQNFEAFIEAFSDNHQQK